jgi:CRISPR-associated endonuclease/helicase Cas3
MKFYIAHVRKTDDKKQSVEEHLLEVAEIAKKLAAKINIAEAGELIGLLHDFGKYSAAFQNYIKSATGLLDPDCDDEYVDAKGKKGKIDHSTAGAQWLWQAMSKIGNNGEGKLCGQILALCIASHHSGLMDCLKPDGTNEFQRRMFKEDEQTHLAECQQNADADILDMAQQRLKPVISAMWKQRNAIMRTTQQTETIRQFYFGFWTRFLFSCLIDADRINSADFENPEQKEHRNQTVSWDVAINRLECFLVEQQHNIERETHKLTENTLRLNEIRSDISNTCQQRAQDAQGIYTLTVPTGGGKTYASLRFALSHAKQHGLERVFYIIPYTSIIEQNAEAIRKTIEHEGDERPWVLEHHSNLEPEQQTWHSKLVAENFDAPIVMTTMVQFLETLFSGGTRGVRRLHQFANSVIIFDEIQTLPINCVHLFCNALNFLTTYAKTTAVLCTATQPLLNHLKTPEKGQLAIPQENELIADVADLFRQLKRVDIMNKTKPEGWSQEEIAHLALNEFREKGSCLVIVNTKAWAAVLYRDCVTQVNDKEGVFHLSTHQCSAHRTAIFNTIKARLKNKQPVLCFSTQLIEAGVDISFASVIRFLAGLDSIAQAAGRCNRNAELDKAEVHVINPAKETIDQLIDINEGKKQTARVFREMAGQELLAPDVMESYFKYYFYERAEQMVYPVSDKIAERNDTLLNLLSENKWNNGKNAPLDLKQAFMTAGKAFKAIDAPTHSVIVPYGEGEALITELCGFSKKFEAKAFYACLKKAQKYSVNVFPNVWKKLIESDAIAEIQGEGVFYLKKSFYSDEFGLAIEVVSKEGGLVL